MPNELCHADIHIRDKIRKLEAYYHCQKTFTEEHIGGTNSTWVWFKRMRQTMGGTTKGGGGPMGGCNQGHPSWTEPLQGQGYVLEAHVEDIERSSIGRTTPILDPLVDLDPETSVMVGTTNLQHI